MHIDWDTLKIFHEVARYCNFSHAAERLNISQSALSKRINNLEENLGFKLFHRHSRGLHLTHGGKIYFEGVCSMRTALETAYKRSEAASNKIAGRLKIATTYGFASTVVYEHLCNFEKLHPEATLDLICDDHDLDLKVWEADIAIRGKPQELANLESYFLTARYLQLYASQEYIEKFGNPKTPADLDNHRLIVFENAKMSLPYANNAWILTIGAPQGYLRTAYKTVNSVECLYQAIIKGLGIAALSHDSKLVKDPNLIPILPDLKSPPNEMYIIYHQYMANNKLITSLKDYLIKIFSEI